MGQVWTLELPRSERDVLLALADHAHDDGTAAEPGVAYLAWKTDLARSTVHVALRSLEKRLVIVAVRAGGGRGRKTGYRLDLGKSPRKQPFVESVRGTAETVRSGPDAAGETVRLPDGTAGETVRSGLAREEQPPLEQTPQEQPPRARDLARRSPAPPATVDRLPVTATESEVAAAVLAEWNRQTGQTLTSPDWLAKIVMRVREYPDLPVEEHGRVIAATLADPWWQKRAPDPALVYGNGAQFERCLLAVAAPPATGRPPPRRYGYGLGTEEILAVGERLQREQEARGE